MKPNFALNLSYDGLALLHRTSAGWHHVAEVSVDSERLNEELAQLRKQAEDLSTGPVTTKLIIPDAQILYHRLPDPGEARRDAAIRAALEGATPYAVEDLVWDHRLVDGELQLAVVARETLVEAEAFTSDHGLNPVSFAAWPAPESFAGEPDFGRTKDADAVIGTQTEVEPDREVMPVLPTPAPLTDTATAPLPHVESAAPVIPPTQDAPEDIDPARMGATLTPDTLTASKISTASDQTTVFGAQRTAPRQTSAKRLKLGLAAGLVALIAAGIFGVATSKWPPSLPAVETELDVANISPDELSSEPEPEIEPDAKVDPAAEAEVEPEGEAEQQPEPEAENETNLAQETETEVATASETEVETSGQTTPIDHTAPPAPPIQVTPITPEDRAKFEANYAATGIWPLAPEAQKPPKIEDGLVDLYTASIDPKIASQDAVALADAAGHESRVELPPRATTAPPGTEYDLDDAGFIRATKDGIVTPEGVRVFAGRPNKAPGARPERAPDPAPSLTDLATDPNDPVRQSLAEARPSYRPEALLETTERAQLGGLTRAQLGAFRPTLRPKTAPQAPAELPSESETTEDATPAPARTAPVVTVSQRPAPRPQDINKLVAAAAAAAKAASAPQSVGRTTSSSSANKVTARVPDTQIPSSAPSSVARAATDQNAINMRRLNLMGVYGASKDRRALIRLPNGKFVKVKVGDRLDGGRVQSIESSSLTYVKNGRAQTLKIGS